MTTPEKARGSAFERDVVAVFNDYGFNTERRFGAGQQKDRGDISGLTDWVVECKNLSRITLASIVDETEVERVNAKKRWGVSVIKRRGKGASESYAVMKLSRFAEVLQHIERRQDNE